MLKASVIRYMPAHNNIFRKEAMPIARARFATLTSWSYSVYTQYVKCPMSVCFEKIQKIRIQEPPNPHFEKGDRVHAAGEQFVGSMGTKPPTLIPELSKFGKDMLELRKAKARTEQEWAFDKMYNPVSWFDRQAWLRMKVDACADSAEPPLVKIVDYKTGKVHEEHKQQRTIYALGGLTLVKLGVLAGGNKDVVLTASHWYTDTGQRAT